MTTLLFDIETDGLLAEVTKIHCLVIHNVETGETRRFIDRAGRMGKGFAFTHVKPTEAKFYAPEEVIPIEIGPDGLPRIKRDPDQYTLVEGGWLEEGILLLQDADVIVGHNIVRFDIPVLQKFYPWFNPRGKVRDTLVIAKLIWPNLKVLDKGDVRLPGLIGSHSLKAWGIRLDAHKGNFGETSDWKTFTPEMLEYCVQDVVGPTLALWKLILKKNYSEEAIQVEHDFTYVAFLMELHGFRFDVATAQKLHVTLVKRRLELEVQLQAKYKGWWEDMKTPEYWTAEWIDDRAFRWHTQAPTKGDADASLWFQIKKRGAKRKDMVFTQGPMAKKHTPFSPSSRHHITKVLMEEHGWKPQKFTPGGDPTLDEEVLEGLDIPEAKLIIEYLMLDKRIGQLAEGDGAWLKLVRKDDRIYHRCDSMGTVTSRCSHSGPNIGQVPSVDSIYGPEMRALFLPNPGHVLVGADASGIQLRVIAHYAGRWDGGTYSDLITKGDIHTANQKAAGLPTRGHAKTFIYAWLLGAGDAKIGSITGKGSKEGKELKARFLAGFPALKALKEELNTISRENGSIRGLDGRLMPAENGHAAMGSLLQGFEAVIMKKATWFLYSDLVSRGFIHGKDWGLCAFVHDEWQISCRKEIADEIGKAATAAIVKAGEYFKSRCPLAGEYKTGRNWAETH